MTVQRDNHRIGQRRGSGVLMPRAFARRAFTLIEILIVVAIIALLAAILFPAFSRARENARRSSCSSNMKQIALGFAQYAQDYDEKLPFATTTPHTRFSDGAPITTCAASATTCSRTSWPDLLDPYVKNGQVFNDPSRVNKYFDGCAWLAGTGAGAACGSGASGLLEPNKSQPWVYQGRMASALNESGTRRADRAGLAYGYALELTLSVTTNFPRSLVEIAYPAEYLLIAEGANLTIGRPSAGACGYIIPRHFNGVNVAFVDGHVKWQKWDFVCSDENTSDETKRLWYPNGVDLSS